MLTTAFGEAYAMPMQRVVTASGEEYDIPMHPDMTIGDLKDAIAEAHGVPSQRQRILFLGRELADRNQALCDAGIIMGMPVNMAQQQSEQPKAAPAAEEKEEKPWWLRLLIPDSLSVQATLGEWTTLDQLPADTQEEIQVLLKAQPQQLKPHLAAVRRVGGVSEIRKARPQQHGPTGVPCAIIGRSFGLAELEPAAAM
mmetsp:Transcript_106789/g.341019  ORF Transcript_106789/g.341019 Transcript_106789/m.341019 type:complete len:198 (-) Transcript_106789:110-703(-)